jgi:hypothetical protein
VYLVKITPIAADSLGTRSMATFVETKDAKILIDPGVALGPSRYGLPPHPIELQRMNEHWDAVKKFAERAEVLIVTHYHYDHHDPSEPEIYKDKTVFLKHPTEKINYSQKGRAAYFLEQIKGLPGQLEFSDGNAFSLEKTKIRFSQPVFHGTNSKLGYVTEVSIREKDSCFVFTSDVEGPSIEDQVAFVLKEKPTVVFVDGPLSYMLGFRYSKASLQYSIKNMTRIIKETPLEKLVLDHHLLRDLKWKERIEAVFEIAKQEDCEILTMAEFSGRENDMLEARRKELYKKA